MNMTDWIYFVLGTAVVASPMVLLVLLGLASLSSIDLPENAISKLTNASLTIGLLAAGAILALMISQGNPSVPLDFGNWVSIPDQHYHFAIKFTFDRLSMPMLLLSLLLCSVVASFTSRYLHREPGYRRFYLLYAVFLLGMVVSSLAGTIETLFFGWEMVGLSSALLVAYFHERENPVVNGLRVWSIYRLSDAAFLVAAITMHHLTGAGDFAAFAGEGVWPAGQAALSSHHATLVGVLLLIAAAGKSALVPFSGWLPRAMEGPTPSSAIFYGSLSVHLGAYLLLRVSPIIDASLTVQILTVLIGLTTAVFASIMSRVQSDIKGSLAYASLTQVSIIVVEIGLGFRYLALLHIVGHACLRTLQLLRAPSLLHDYHTLENAIGNESHEQAALHKQPWFLRYASMKAQRIVFRFGVERGFMDQALDVWVMKPFVSTFRYFDSLERKWTDWISREPSRESDAAEHHPESIERTAS